MKLRIWWIANPPNRPFKLKVKDLEEAKERLILLANFDLFLKDLVDTNIGGLENLNEEDEWEEWYDEYGDDIDQYLNYDKTKTDIRIWFIPSARSKDTFYFYAKTIDSSKELLQILEDYNKYLFTHPKSHLGCGIEIFNQDWKEYEE